MRAIAVEQAKMRLARAERAIEAYDKATTVDEGKAAWTDFLLAAATIYSKLEQGAKGCGKSEGWFGKKKNERRKDALLRYLHYARNSDEHGIEEVAAVSPPNRDYRGKPLKFNERTPVKVQIEDEKGTNKFTGPLLDAFFAGPTLRPIRVHDRRFNDYCDPPTEHMRKRILLSDFVPDIAKAAIPYLREMVSEAENLVA